MAQNPSSPGPRPPAKRLIPILLSGAGLVLLGGSGILAGLSSKLTSLQTSAQQQEAEVSSNQQIAHRYETTLDTYTQTQAHTQYLETSVSEKSYVPTLLAQLQGLAAQTHLTMSAVRPSAPPPAAAPAAAAPRSGSAGAGDAAPGAKTPPPPPPYDTLDVAVDVSGSYADTSMFLYSLTRFPKIISVDSVTMHPGTAVPGGPEVVATSLKLTAFMFHDAPDAAQPAGLPNAATAQVPTQMPVLTPGTAQPPASRVPGPGGMVGAAAGRAAFGAVPATQAAGTRSAGEIRTF